MWSEGKLRYITHQSAFLAKHRYRGRSSNSHVIIYYISIDEINYMEFNKPCNSRATNLSGHVRTSSLEKVRTCQCVSTPVIRDTHANAALSPLSLNSFPAARYSPQST